MLLFSYSLCADSLSICDSYENIMWRHEDPIMQRYANRREDNQCILQYLKHKDICDSYKNAMQRYECVKQRLESDDYSTFCDDKLSDSCSFVRNSMRIKDENIKIELRDRKNDKLMCDVFGCDMSKDSSFFMIMNDVAFFSHKYINISRYNKEYLLIRVHIRANEMGNVAYVEEILRNNDGSIWLYGNDCKLTIYPKVGLYSADSRCDLTTLITALSPKTNSICFIPYITSPEYILKKENNIVNEILKLKSESIKYNRPNLNPTENYEDCLSSLLLIKAEYNYDYMYIYSFNPSEFCDLNNWKGIRLKDQSESGKSLLESILVPTDNCLWYSLPNVDINLLESQLEKILPRPEVRKRK